MALDNANFIAELSVTDPPGTDPLSQGDDQIRTIKRATQQSFPNIDKAVTLTADQMNLAAILNEANVFTANQTIKERLFLGRNTNSGFTQWTLRDEGDVNVWTLFMDTFANGNDLVLNRLVGGLPQDEPYRISNATGIVDFAQLPSVGGVPIWVAGEVRTFVNTATPGDNWFLADGTNGTLNLQDRWLVGAGAFSAPAGTGINAALNTVTTATGVTGSTALTEAQLAAHTHRIWSGGAANGVTDVTFATADTVTGANRGNTSKIYRDTTASGAQIIEAAGSGSGHTHADGGNALVLGQPTFTDTVQPVSMAVAYYQYVP